MSWEFAREQRAIQAEARALAREVIAPRPPRWTAASMPVPEPSVPDLGEHAPTSWQN